MTVHDRGRGVRTERSDVPYGVAVTENGHTRVLSLERLPASPMRTQLRDALLSYGSDRGGTLRTTASFDNNVAAAVWLGRTLGEALGGPLDVRTLREEDVHAYVFRSLPDPVPQTLVLARKVLRTAAGSVGRTDLTTYLGNIKMYAYTPRGGGSKPYTEEELKALLDAAKQCLHDLDRRHTRALAVLGLPTNATDDEAVAAAQLVLANPPETVERPDSKIYDHRWREAPSNAAWWTAHVLVNGFSLVPPKNSFQAAHFKTARDAFFPTLDEAQAVLMLVINEFGVEGQVLAGLRIGDQRRLGGEDSAVVEIRGVKARADRAVSRRGNAVSNWSGGRVLERWVRHTAAARRWTGTDLTWQFRLLSPREGNPRLLRSPISNFLPGPKIIVGTSGHDRRVPLPGGGHVTFSPQRARKTWTARSERVLGSVIAGAIDPAHSANVSWAFYRSAAYNEDERRAVLGDAQDDLDGMVKAVLVVSELGPEADVAEGLRRQGVTEAVIKRLVTGDLDDSGTTLCSDPRSAPSQAVGSMCRQTPFACLLCKNAIHTQVHLPVLLALQESLAADRSTRPAEEYLAAWAGVDVALDNIIGRFSARAVETARCDMTAAQDRLTKMKEAFR